jgi:uncharacterized radical SAM superfamily Fe-S cluster-containing enzyme
VCPVCLRRVSARIILRDGARYLEKSCPEHGDFSTVIWRGEDEIFAKWWDPLPKSPPAPDSCPTGCDTCREHLTKTCCALVEVTARCNLRCPVCFADANANPPDDPTVGELYSRFKALALQGNTFVQLSGGEPTVRDDLPEIVRAAKLAGCETVQLNSNGLRLGREPDFTRRLAEAGLSFVFMQFDGVTDRPYEVLRGAPLLAEKRLAIDICDENNLGVTLVPTVVPGVNDTELGAIVEYALSRSPAVRGVHFQPVSYFGRYELAQSPRDEDRITIPEILRGIEDQTRGKVKIADFVPSSCDHPRCGFHSDFVVLPRGMLLRLTPKYKPGQCCSDESADKSSENNADKNAHLKNRKFVSRRWTRPEKGSEAPAETEDFNDMSSFLSRVKSHGFTITGMAFQDAWTLELDRLRRCSLHAARPHVADSQSVSDGLPVADNDATVIPFCARYITAAHSQTP